MISVGNVKRGGPHGYIGIYIGRAGYGLKGSPLANPFKMNKEAERAEVIERYRTYIQKKIEERDQAVLDELREIEHAHRKGEKVVLLCWCAPRACHGDVVKELIEADVNGDLLADIDSDPPMTGNYCVMCGCKKVHDVDTDGLRCANPFCASLSE